MLESDRGTNAVYEQITANTLEAVTLEAPVLQLFEFHMCPRLSSVTIERPAVGLGVEAEAGARVNQGT
jgi:hypothetical protein